MDPHPPDFNYRAFKTVKHLGSDTTPAFRNPEPFVWKQVERDGYKGKQLQTNPPRRGRLPNTYFEKKHLWVSEVRF